MKELTYIHFSDLHIGDKLASPILSHVKDELVDDLNYICQTLGHIDLVFMTGDLVQTGAKGEYDEFQAFFDALVAVMEKNGNSPHIFFVPGNHDLSRVAKTSDSVHQVLKGWTGNTEAREYLFWEKDSDYQKYCQERFHNYDTFVRKYNANRCLTPKYGLLPGDYFSSLEINELKIGILGLNSSWLQIEGGDYQGKLGIYLKQVSALFGTKYIESLKANDLNFLLTHHQSDWFEPHSKQEYDGEIYLKKYISEHYCGHNHVPLTSYQNVNFAGTSRVDVAPSLCGLETYGEDHDKLDRIHGYHAGRYQVDDDGSIIKTIYPRIAVRRGFSYEFTSDQSYGLKRGEQYATITIREAKMPEFDIDSPVNDIKDVLTPSRISGTDVKLHPTVIKNGENYKSVRKQEQREAVNILERSRCLWIGTSFGLGDEQFLHCTLNMANIKIGSIFMVDCDEITTMDELKRQVREHFSVPLNNLIDELLSAYPEPVLIFRNISTLFAQNALSELSNFAMTVLRYNPKIRLIFVSSYSAVSSHFESVTLNPLDIQDVRYYLDVAIPYEAFTAVEVEKIHSLTNGYPMCLDIVANNLVFAPLDELSDFDFSFADSSLTLPKVTKDYIKNLKASSQRDERNCYSLLLLLSLLPKGDLFSSIKRFNSTSPFRMEEVSTLITRELIVIDHYYVIKNSSLISQTKVLRVPKIYRDFILSLEDHDSLRQLNQSICAMYLGDSWTGGSVSLPKTRKDEYNPFVYYNLEAALTALLHNSIEQGDDVMLARYLKVAGNYVCQLERQDMYYVALYVAESFYQQAKNVHTVEGQKPLAFLKYQLAEAYRMNGQPNEAVILFEELLDEHILCKGDIQSSRISLGYIYLKRGDNEKALYYADELQRDERGKKNSLNALTARYIRASLLRNKTSDIKELLSLYKAFRKKGNSQIMLSNIAICISQSAPSTSSLQLLEEQSRNQDSVYTWMRVTLRRIAMYSLPQFSRTLSESDIEAVKKVYSFSFSQMIIPMVNESHDILWKRYQATADYEQLMVLLRHSIYVWDLNDLREKPTEYIEELSTDKGFLSWANSYTGRNQETRLLLEDIKNK